MIIGNHSIFVQIVYMCNLKLYTNSIHTINITTYAY